MNDSAATTGAQVIAGIQGLSMVWIGIPYLCCLWGLFGAFAGIALTPPESKGSAIVTVLLSWAAGAAGGFGLFTFLGGGNATMAIGSFVIGAGAKKLIPMAIEFVGKVGQKP